jgi:aryl-alcohol dehydrogenase-like predicted oxidoreductase
MTASTTRPVAASGTFALGGDLPVHRLGYGAMRITGPGIWGQPADPEQAKAVLRRAVELGVDLIDTADSYGPYVSEDLIREALHPYDGVLIATKGGLTRHGPDQWEQVGRPEYLRQCVEMSLRRLGVEQIGLWQLHRIDAQVPLEDSLGAVKELQDGRKIRHIGLSEVSVGGDRAGAAGRRRGLRCRTSTTSGTGSPRRSCSTASARGIGFLPWFPVAGRRAGPPRACWTRSRRDHTRRTPSSRCPGCCAAPP